jgi:uncharacterized membrane protein YeaQ/YmgE (transglycosylase-associated protein family)
MLILAWVLSGLVSGLFIGRFVSTARETSTDIVLGIVGGVLGGVALHALGPPDGYYVEVWSFLLPIIGAATLIVVYYSIVGRNVVSR